MEVTTGYANISMAVNPDDGEVTLFISNEKWGPVVTGKNLAEAKAKMKEAFGLSMIINSYCSTQHIREKEPLSNIIKEYSEKLKSVNNTLEHSL